MATKKTFIDQIENPAEIFIDKPQEQPAKAEKRQETTKAPEGYHINPIYVENKTKRLQLLTKPSTLEKLRKRARSEGTSVNNIVNTILEEALREE